MSGYEKNQERVMALNLLGKELARRAKSKCELCETAGVRLSAYEVPPVPKEPDVYATILICDDCLTPLANERKFQPDERWRVLASTVWGELPAVQVVAVRLLRKLAETEDWARESIEQLYLDPAVEEWIERV